MMPVYYWLAAHPLSNCPSPPMLPWLLVLLALALSLSISFSPIAPSASSFLYLPFSSSVLPPSLSLPFSPLPLSPLPHSPLSLSPLPNSPLPHSPLSLYPAPWRLQMHDALVSLCMVMLIGERGRHRTVTLGLSTCMLIHCTCMLGTRG